MSRSNCLACALLLFILGVLIIGNTSAQKHTSRKPPGFVIAPKHYTPNSESVQSKAGKALFQKHNCATCHSIDSKGGCLAPPLDGIGARRNETFILARITDDPAAIKRFDKLHGPELMPHPRLTAQRANLIAAYLLTLPEPKGGVRVLSHAPNEQSAKNSLGSIAAGNAVKGKKLFFERGCIACHSIGDIGGHFAPSLDSVSSKRSRQFITERINNAEFVTQTNADEYQGRGNIMPPSNLNTQEISSITEFLMSLPSRSPDAP